MHRSGTGMTGRRDFLRAAGGATLLAAALDLRLLDRVDVTVV